MTADPALDQLEAALAQVAEVSRLLVAVDFDGTLAPIVATPDAAVALPAGARAVRALAEQPGTTVAVVSGRARADLAEATTRSGLPPGVTLVGSHGAELAGDVGRLPDAATRLLAETVAAVRRLAADVPGALVEPKPAGVAVHVRLADPDEGARLLTRIRQGPGAAPGVHLTEGHAVLDLSVLTADKGTAVDRLREHVGADAVVYVGDDVTDERALAALRPGDLGIRVGPGDTAAAHRVADPAEVAVVLARLGRLRAGLWSAAPPTR